MTDLEKRLAEINAREDEARLDMTAWAIGLMALIIVCTLSWGALKIGGAL